MSIRRLPIICLPWLAVTLVAGDVHACWLTDWLFGRHHAPMAVSPGVVGAPYVAGYSPVITTPGTTVSAYSAQYPSFVDNAFVDNANVYTGLVPNTGFTPTTSQPFVAARPAESWNGQVMMAGGAATTLPAVSANRIPLAGTIRGLQTTSNPFYGTGNQYPNNYQQPAYGVANPYVSGTAGAAAVQAAPSTAVSLTPGLPLYPASPPPRRGGLARFFGRLLGTNYQTSYYTAPITYYRPVTSVDPVTGTTVTVQQPCTSTVQQLQRTPIRSLSPLQTPITSAPLTATPPAASCPLPDAQYGASPQYDTAPQYGAAPSYGSAPSYGAGPAYDTGSAVGSPSDQTPVPPPQLQSARPTFESPDNSPTSNGYNSGGYNSGASPFSSGAESPDSGGNGNNNGTRESSGGANGYGESNNAAAYRAPSALTPAGRQPARPIPAPDDDPSFSSDPFSLRPSTLDEDRSAPSAGGRSTTLPRLSAPVREASLIRESTSIDESSRPVRADWTSPAEREIPVPSKNPRPTKRESGWYTPGR